MIDIVKKSMLAGIGFASLTKEKVEEVAAELKKQGSISEQEGRKFVDEMMTHAEKARGDVQKTIELALTKSLEKLDLARKSDVDELRKTIDELQKKLDADKG